MKISVPTATLQEEGKVRINMTCNPYGCSNDGKRVTFGHWEQTKASLVGKEADGNDTTFDLKQEQGPYIPTADSLTNSKSASGNAGTATPAKLGIKQPKLSPSQRSNLSSRMSSSTASSTGARRNSANRAAQRNNQRNQLGGARALQSRAPPKRGTSQAPAKAQA